MHISMLRVFLRFTLFLSIGFASSLAAPAAGARPPNVLVIVADDLGYADIGVNGGRELPTPNIDRLAASGVRCTSGYVSAPMCAPSRAGLLTGRYQTRFGFEHNPRVGDELKLGLPSDQRTLADHLRGGGFATSLVGKWHQGFTAAFLPQARGFDEFFGLLVAQHNFILRAEAEPQFEAAYSRNMIYRGRELQHLDGYTTDMFTEEAVAFIKRQTGKPWFLYLAYNAVHAPLEVLKKYGDRVPAAVTDQERRGYLSLLVGLDDGVGRVLDQLSELGIEKDTLVFFLSDNGGAGKKPFLSYNAASNLPLRGNKGQILEGGIRVPFFVSWPGRIPAGRTYDEPVISLDISATAIKAAALPVPAALDGVDLLPFLEGKKTGSPHEFLCWRLGPQKAIRQGRWKLEDWRDFSAKTQSGWQLYDLSADVGETNDLAAKHPEIVADLARTWDRWNSANVPALWQGSSTEDPTAPEYRPLKKKSK